MAKRTLPGTVKPRKSKRTKKNVEIPTSNIIRGIKQSLREQGFTINGKIKSVKSTKKEKKSYVAGPRGPILVNGPIFKKLTEMGYKFKKTSKFITGVMIQPKVISNNNNKGNPIVNAAKQTFSGIFGGTPPEIKKPVNAEASTRNNAGNGGKNNMGNGGNVKTNTRNNAGNVGKNNMVNGGNFKTNNRNNMGNGGNVKTNTRNNMGNGGNVNTANKVNGGNVNTANKVNGGNVNAANKVNGVNINAANKVNGGNVNTANKVNGGNVNTANKVNGGNSQQTEENPRNNGNKM